MALFFDYKIQSPISDPNYLFFEWHSTFPILAIASYSRNSTGQIHLHLEEGDHDDTVAIQRAAQPSRIAWHPKRKILITCWEGGEITIYNDATKRLETASNYHQQTVMCLSWSSNGTRLMTGDKLGNVILWKFDANGKLNQQTLNKFNIGESVTSIIVKPAHHVDHEKDFRELARAAVSGDENALEAFDYKRGTKPTQNKSTAIFGLNESLSFLLSGDKGSVYCINEHGKYFKLYQMESSVIKLVYNMEKSILISLTDNLMLGEYILKSDTEVHNIMTVKLNGGSSEADFIWLNNTLLAYVSGESVVRILDMEKDDNYMLTLSSKYDYHTNEKLLCISYSPSKGLIACGTDRGHIAMWKYSQYKMKSGEPESCWQLMSSKLLLSDTPIKSLKFGTNLSLLCANLVNDAYILSEQKMSSDFRDDLAAVQLGPNIIHLAFLKQNLVKEEKVDLQFKGLATAKNHIVIWNSKQIRVYEMVVGNTSNLDEKIQREERGNFACTPYACGIYDQNIYTLEPSRVNIRTFQGTVKQIIQFTDLEGDPVLISLNGKFMCLGSTNGIIKVYDLSRREAKQIGGSLSLKQKFPYIDSLKQISVSCDGAKVCITASRRDNIPDDKLYIWNLEKDSVGYFNFKTGLNDLDEVILATGEDNRTTYEKSKHEISKDVCGRYPELHYWDHSDNRLFVCEAFLQHNSSTILNAKLYTEAAEADLNEPAECLVVSMFFNIDSGLLVYDSYARDEIYSKLISINIPYHFFVTKGRMVESEGQRLLYEGYQVPKLEENGENAQQDQAVDTLSKDYLFYSEFLAAKIMRDFIGMVDADKSTSEALLNFSYYLTIGDMDEAFKSIKLIKKATVWENMAQMCVKSHRIDVAKVCLSNMKNAKGIKLLRDEIQRGADTDTQIAVVALSLGMTEEAEKLLINNKRYDLLNKFYQNSDMWQKAIEIAQKYDRIHLRNTFYSFAKYCEEKNDVQAAIEYYEKSDTHRVEVPRMFLERNELVNLHAYTAKVKDKELFRWWGQYFETMGNMENAINFYRDAQDNLSLCRVYCYNDNLNKAIELCNETNDSTACFHLARQFERLKNYKEAINYYQRAGAISNAIRLCKENDMNDYLANLAFQGSKQDMLDAARHYEKTSDQEDKAVILYYKAGHTSKAIDLAFKANKYSALALITDGINEKTDPSLVIKMANFFLENDQFDKAVDLFAVTKKTDQAIDLLVKHNVQITEELAQKLTPPKPTSDGNLNAYYNTLELLGDAAFDQQQYTLAAKKYTEANNRMKAMKSLMKSGDTQRVIFFANVQKQREIYIMAANYLQSLDWRKDPDVMKHIINFYTRGKSMESLSGFYEACAQVEIDEFQDYEKAFSALEEAFKCLTRNNQDDALKGEEQLTKLKFKMALIRKFLEAKSKLSSGQEDGLRDLQQLLQTQNLEYAVRLGDIFSMIVEYQANKLRWKQAFAALQEMKEHMPESSIQYYVSPKLLVAIYREMNIEYNPRESRRKQTESVNANDIDSNDIRDDVGYGTYDD